jgi:hypothetical protein
VDTENTIHKKTTYLYPNKRKDRITTTAFIVDDDDDETQIQIDWYIVLTSSAMGRYRRTQYIKEDFMSLHFKAQEYASCRDIFMRRSLIKLLYGGKNIFCLF